MHSTTQNIEFNYSHLIGDTTGIVTGYSLANPNGEILGYAKAIIANIFPAISQPVADEITRAVAALVITFVSRIMFSYLDKKKEKRIAKKNEHKQ